MRVRSVARGASHEPSRWRSGAISARLKALWPSPWKQRPRANVGPRSLVAAKANSYLVDNVYPFTPSGHFAPAGYRISAAAIVPALTPLLK
jgi:hypothetical protein